MIILVNIIESGNRFGSISTSTIKIDTLSEEDKAFLCRIKNLDPQGLKDYFLTDEDKANILMTHRRQFGCAYGFDGSKMFTADQDSFKPGSTLTHGTYFEITRDYVEANPEGWSDIPEDILVIKKDVPGVVIGHSLADCPAVILTDQKQGISAVAHCGAAMIDAHLPEMLTEVMLSTYGSKAEDVLAYVSACAGDTWTYDCFPKWAKDMKIWDHLIYQGTDGKFHINIRPAVLEQLLKAGIDRCRIVANQDDTITHPDYYSNCAASPKGGNDPTKLGRHFAGIFYQEDDDEKILMRGPYK